MFKSNALYYIKWEISSSAVAGATFPISTDFELEEHLETGADNVSIIIKNKTQLERMVISATWWIATIIKRWLDQTELKTEVAWLRKTWSEGAIFAVTALASDLYDVDTAISTAFASKLDKVWGLRTGMGNTNVSDSEFNISGVEVLRARASATTALDTDLVTFIDPSTRARKEMTYAGVKNSIQSTINYTQTAPLGESIAPWYWTTTSDTFSLVWNIPWTWTLWNRVQFPTSAKRIQTITYSKNATNALAAIVVATNAWVVLWTYPVSVWSATATVNTLVKSWEIIKVYVNDMAYFWWTYAELTSWIPSYIVNGFNWATDYSNRLWIAGISYQDYTESINAIAIVNWAIAYSNTMWSNIVWNRVLTWIRFSVPYNTTLWIVKSSQVATGAGARIQLRDDSWTLIAEQTPWIGSDTVTFPGTTISANIVYRLVMNDNSNFWNNSNELSLETYKWWFQFAVSWTLNGVNSVLPQNIKEVQLWTTKAMRALASWTSEYASYSWFLVWSKIKGSEVQLSANDGNVIDWFSWLTPLTKYYISNIPWLISTTAWTISRVIWMAVSPTQIYLSSPYYPWTTITKP